MAALTESHLAVELPGGDRAWWSGGDEAFFVAHDPLLNHPESGDGLWNTYSINPKSANYHPRNFNRVCDMLRALDAPAPEDRADESIPRRIDKRIRLGIWRKPI